ncbi:MAG: RpoL/Rpb11 RNA polymerase subunit family protein [Promethearchaeota archaeon]
MAKKKTSKKSSKKGSEEEEDISDDELEESLFGAEDEEEDLDTELDQDIEELLDEDLEGEEEAEGKSKKTKGKGKGKSKKSSGADDSSVSSSTSEVSSSSGILSGEEEEKTFKFLRARIEERNGNFYTIRIKGASHTFLNYITTKLLDEKGVEYAAYKLTTLEPPRLSIIIDGSVPLKTILLSVTKKMKDEIKELKKVINANIKD